MPHTSYARKLNSVILIIIWLVTLTPAANVVALRPTAVQQSRTPKLLTETHDDKHVDLSDTENQPFTISDSARGDAAKQARANEVFGKLPLQFEANAGQVDPKVKFVSRGAGYTLFLTATETVLALQNTGSRLRGENSAASSLKSKKPQHGVQTRQATVLQMKLVDANAAPAIRGVEELPGHANYFVGADPAKFHMGVATYGRVRYESVYKGVDLIYYGNQQQLEYDFVVAPGGDARQIKLVFDGADKVEVDTNGDLVLRVGNEVVRQHKPVIYQQVDGERRVIAGRYVQTNRRQVGFEIEKYDATRPLVIDPVLSYATYLGTNAEFIRAVVADADGNVYVAGSTNSLNFPVTSNALQKKLASAQTATGYLPSDAFVAKINQSGTALVFSTYLGGDNTDLSTNLALDAANNLYLSGITDSTNFPVTTNAFAPVARKPNSTTSFIAKFDAMGSALIFSGFSSVGNRIAVDAKGAVYVAGASALGFPVTANAFQSAPRDARGNSLIAKFVPVSTDSFEMVYATYLGGSGGPQPFSGTLPPGFTNPPGEMDTIYGIAVDRNGDISVVGVTASPDFPVTSNAYQKKLAPSTYGATDIFVAKINPNNFGAESLTYSTYFGGTGNEKSVGGIATDTAGNIYVAGQTFSQDLPVTPGALQTKNASPLNGSGDDAFVAKFNPTAATGAKSLVYATYLGGSGRDTGTSIAVDASGNAYVTGGTYSNNFPITANAFQTSNGGVSNSISAPGGDAFVAKLDATGTSLVYFSYLGGKSGDEGDNITLDANGNVYVTGYTFSTDFPVTKNAVQASLRGGFVGFIAKISATPSAGVPAANLTSTYNPINDSSKFVRQQYLDFLSREPDTSGLAYWTNQIQSCGNNAKCLSDKRADVAAAFFIEQEFQATGSFVYRLYKASFNRRPSYSEFMPDRARLIGGATLETAKQNFIAEWVQRDEFQQSYPTTMTNADFVNKLYDSATLKPYATERQQQITAMANGKSRAQVLGDVVEIAEFKQREYNPSFVLMQYFGYLKRDPEEFGYKFWLDVVNNRDPNNYRGMVWAFINSVEYLDRFGTVPQ